MKAEQIIDFVRNLDCGKYAKDNGILEFFGNSEVTDFDVNNPWSTAAAAGGDAFPPDFDDLARLHAIVRKAKVINILEFGSGKSTLIMGKALSENSQEFKSQLAGIRRSTPFKLISLESEQKYKQEVNQECVERNLSDFVEVVFTEAEETFFNGRICGHYKSVPSCCPDLIYVDGPMPMSYLNAAEKYMDMRHPDITNITCDVLILEPCLLPGTIIIIDGMTNNSRFIRHNLQRNWISHEDINADFTVLVLDEPPLGRYHLRQLAFQNGV